MNFVFSVVFSGRVPAGRGGLPRRRSGRASLPDNTPVGLLARFMARELADGVLTGTGGQDQRKGCSRPRAAVYFATSG